MRCQDNQMSTCQKLNVCLQWNWSSHYQGPQKSKGITKLQSCSRTWWVSMNHTLWCCIHCKEVLTGKIKRCDLPEGSELQDTELKASFKMNFMSSKVLPYGGKGIWLTRILINCTLTAQLSYLFRIGGPGQPPATIWFSQMVKENIIFPCQVLQARCENQPCSPHGAHGTTNGHTSWWLPGAQNRSKYWLCWGICSCTAQTNREANP